MASTFQNFDRNIYILDVNCGNLGMSNQKIIQIDFQSQFSISKSSKIGCLMTEFKQSFFFGDIKY